MRPPHQAQLPLKEDKEIRRPNQCCLHQPRVQNGLSLNMLNITPALQDDYSSLLEPCRENKNCGYH